MLELGNRFDPNEFVRTLQAAAVDSIVVFAKDMHGYCYYPSVVGPVHPGLSRDLMGEQITACRKAGIAVYAYYCTLWDHYLAEHHPEWLSVQRNGQTYMPAAGEAPGWTALCSSNEEFVGLIESHIREILTGYRPDGIWFDMPIPRDGECFCANCIAALKAISKDPYDVAAQRVHQHDLHKRFLERLHTLSKSLLPNCQVDFNNQVSWHLAERLPWLDSIDIEALPTAQWGYDFFPVAARYVRTFPRTAYGMTGRFLRGWGDFGGLKTAHQLKMEMFGILSLGLACDIGDQMHPNGRLDPAVYEAIGEAYAEIARLEPHLEQSSPLAEAAIVSSGLPLDSPATSSLRGLTKVLAELSVQFDVVELSSQWERYGLVVLQDFPIEPDFETRLATFLDEGGRALITGSLGESGAKLLGLDDWSKSPLQPGYAVLAGEHNHDYEFAIYGESSRCKPSGRVLSWEGLPDFERTGEHFTSHLHSPVAVRTGKVNALASECFAWIGFPIGRLYGDTGYWIYRELVRRCLSFALPNQMVKSSFPGAIQATIAGWPQSRKKLIHVLDTTVGRPSPEHPPYYEPAPARADVKLSLDLGEIHSAVALRSGRELKVDAAEDGRFEVIISHLEGYELLLIEPR